MKSFRESVHERELKSMVRAINKAEDERKYTHHLDKLGVGDLQRSSKVRVV